MEGLVRVAAAVPHLYLGHVEKNAQAHLDMMREAAAAHASLVVFPELSLTGATCGDLFFQQTLLRDVESALRHLAEEMPEGLTAVVGAPVYACGRLYNCAAVLQRNEEVSFAPKTFLTAGEKRWFHSSRDANFNAGGAALRQSGAYRSADGVTFGIEIGSDLFAPVPPSTNLALGGAEIIVNLAAMPEVAAARSFRQEAVRQQSARCCCGYVYVSAGTGESTTDGVYAGHSMMASCGDMLRENADFLADGYLMTADIDVDRIRMERVRSAGYGDLLSRNDDHPAWALAESLLLPNDVAPDVRVSRSPFVPEDADKRRERCRQVFAMQAEALARRMTVTGGKIVVGISGGLDSTLALLAACGAADRLGLPRTNILGVTMPCFGTTDWTYQSALELMRTLGVQQREIPIHEAVRLHFRDIGHDESDHSVTYENAQARERTQILMDVANDFGGLVLGTGDLSEIALGWCTYNADHMSMYGVNAGVPKTLVRWVVRTAAEEAGFAESRAVLLRILDTPISPELLPPDEKGNIAQQTEDLVGPYDLHDFFIYYAIRYGYRPAKVYELCRIAFEGAFDDATILKWLKNFYRRFFTQQFKRSCMPDGPAVGVVGFSPRGGWIMPSDAQSAAWLRECEDI